MASANGLRDALVVEWAQYTILRRDCHVPYVLLTLKCYHGHSKAPDRPDTRARFLICPQPSGHSRQGLAHTR